MTSKAEPTARPRDPAQAAGNLEYLRQLLARKGLAPDPALTEAVADAATCPRCGGYVRRPVPS